MKVMKVMKSNDTPALPLFSFQIEKKSCHI